MKGALMSQIREYLSTVYGGLIDLCRDQAITNDEFNTIVNSLTAALSPLSRSLSSERVDVIPAQYDDKYDDTGEEYDFHAKDEADFDRIIDSYERM